MAEMERKGEGRDKEQGMLNMILNLEKDFSSIHEDGSCLEMDKEAVYGLSEIKRKSDKNTPKLEHKPKEKTSIRFTHLNFIKKQVSNFDSANSTSKHSTKSISTRKPKPQGLTPDNHRIKSKSKSMKKKPSKNLPDKKSKLTDT